MGRNRSCMTVNVCSFSLTLFGLLVTMTDGNNCGKRSLTANTGDLRTPNYPSPYPSHSRCSWLIQVPVGYKIRLQFYHFVVETSYECGSDVVRIFDGANSSTTPIGKYCGRKDPFHVESTATSMLITFKSDRSLNFAGFRATFTAIAVHHVKPMSFRRTLKNTTTILGKDVKLLCQVKDGSANVNFYWTKDGKVLTSNNDGPNHSIRVNAVTKRSHLLLEKVSRHHAGVYSCLASDLDMANNISAYGTLEVKVPAVLLEGPASMNANKGNNVVLKCKASGDPVPKLSWQVNGQNMTATQTGFTSELLLKVKEDTIVNCTANNGFGAVWKAAKISVLSPPTVVATLTTEPTLNEWSAPVIIIPPKNVTAEMGHNVTLWCGAKGNPKPKIRWLVDDSKYYEKPADENGMSHLTLTVSKDRTSVRCEAQNQKAIDTRTAYVTVPRVEAIVDSHPTEGLFDGSKFILIIAFASLAVLVIVGAALIIYRRRNLKLQNLASPVDAEKLQSNPIYERHSNHYVNPKLFNWEVPRNRMEFIKELGSGNGAFASIFLGKITPDSSANEDAGKVSLVMVKLLKQSDTQETERENFEKDAIALTTFHHPYVQSLFGVCVDGHPLCLVFEFSEHDESLQEYLIESGRGQCSIHRQAGVQNVKPKLSNLDQISIAKQIANGMEYLANKGYIHRELCSKNCVIGKGMVVKISNLGFSWMGPNTDYYSLDLDERASYPVRWLPPETLQFGTFSQDSDIWSFGVLLWEIYSSGLTPYYGMNDEEVISLVVGEDILPCPKECPKEMYEIMQGCWSQFPSERPRFNSIHQRISSLFNGVPV